MNQLENKEVEIDLLAFARVLWKRKITIFLSTVIVAALAFGYSAFVLKPGYQSSTRIYVVNSNQDKGNPTNQDLQAGSFLVKDYKEIILSQDVLSKVKENLEYSGTTADLAKKITVSVPTDTRIVKMTVSDGNPKNAATIANGLREVAAAKIMEVTKVPDVTTIEEASEPTSPSTPNIRRNTLLGAIAGLVLSVGFLLTAEVLDDRVKRPEDIEERMEITLLGVVPDMNKLK